jgi:flagellar assembly factor FliW
MSTIQLTTSRFGVIEVDKSKIIHFAAPILGFNHLTQYVLLDHAQKSPFKWLQSVADETLAFVLTNPKLFGLDYEFTLPEEAQEKLKIDRIEDILVFTIVNIPSDNPAMMTANFLAPIVINESLLVGVQAVLQDPKLSTKTRLLSDAVINRSTEMKTTQKGNA